MVVKLKVVGNVNLLKNITAYDENEAVIVRSRNPDFRYFKGVSTKEKVYRIQFTEVIPEGGFVVIEQWQDVKEVLYPVDVSFSLGLAGQ